MDKERVNRHKNYLLDQQFRLMRTIDNLEILISEVNNEPFLKENLGDVKYHFKQNHLDEINLLCYLSEKLKKCVEK